jgi:hypothetical protein
MSGLDVTKGAAASPMEYLNETVNTLAHTLVAKLSIPPPPAPEESDDTHRFYLCRLNTDRKDTYTCTKKLQEDAKKGSHDEYVEVYTNGSNNNTVKWVPAIKMVKVKNACPEMFDQLVLSSKLNASVSLALE